MTSVSLTRGGSTFTFDDGEVDSVVSDITATPDADPMPGSAPTSVIIIDLNGSKKTITISGVLKGEGANDAAIIADILTKKQSLESFIDGNQSLITFTSNYDSTSYNGTSFVSTTCVMTRANFDEMTGTPTILPFTINLVVGS